MFVLDQAEPYQIENPCCQEDRKSPEHPGYGISAPRNVFAAKVRFEPCP
jgi:hypothetical protein